MTDHDSYHPTSQPSPSWALWKPFDVVNPNDPSDVYLHRRRIVQTPWFGLYYHRIYRSDNDRDLHDHPWPFVALLLKGGYVEEYASPQDVSRYQLATSSRLKSIPRRHRWFNYIPFDAAHRITSIKGKDGVAKTLVVTGRRRRNPWGFYTEDGWKPWQEYLENAEAG